MSKTIPSKLGLKLLNSVAAGDFATFQRLMHPVVNGGPYIHCRHARALAEVLRKVATGELKRVCVAIAPRHYKSYQASITFPAFLFGLDPSLKIVAASYGQDLAEDFAARSRQIMQSDEYRAVFPDTHLSSKTPAIAKLRTTKCGSASKSDPIERRPRWLNPLYKNTLARMLTGVCRDPVSPRDIKLIQYVNSYRVGSRLERRSTSDGTRWRLNEIGFTNFHPHQQLMAALRGDKLALADSTRSRLQDRSLTQIKALFAGID